LHKNSQSRDFNPKNIEKILDMEIQKKEGKPLIFQKHENSCFSGCTSRKIPITINASKSYSIFSGSDFFKFKNRY